MKPKQTMKKLLKDLNEAYERLRQDPEAWAEYQRERALWDRTLLDGLVSNAELRKRGLLPPQRKTGRRQRV